MSAQDGNAAAAVALVHSFARAWERCDIDDVIAHLDLGIVYRNVPSPALRGREAVRAFITPSLSAMKHMTWEFTACMASADGRQVAAERIDTFFFPEGEVRIEVMGLFEIEGGQIARWRDYCDLGDFVRQMKAIGRISPSELSIAPPGDTPRLTDHGIG